MCGCSAYSGMSGDLNSSVGLMPSNYSGYSNMSDTEKAEYEALLKEANELGYETVAEYVAFLETQNDAESEEKISKLKQWINDGSIEATAKTTLSLINTIAGLFGTNQTTTTQTSSTPTEEEKNKVPLAVWIVGAMVLLLIVFYLYRSSRG